MEKVYSNPKLGEIIKVDGVSLRVIIADPEVKDLCKTCYFNNRTADCLPCEINVVYQEVNEKEDEDENEIEKFIKLYGHKLIVSYMDKDKLFSIMHDDIINYVQEIKDQVDTERALSRIEKII
jgi:hypothetical protein